MVFFQARKKEERFVDGLKKIEPKETSETTHDPETLTPEEHFFFLKMGLKCKNYACWKTGNLPGCNFEHKSALEKAPDFAGGGQDIFARGGPRDCC